MFCTKFKVLICSARGVHHLRHLFDSKTFLYSFVSDVLFALYIKQIFSNLWIGSAWNIWISLPCCVLFLCFFHPFNILIFPYFSPFCFFSF